MSLFQKSGLATGKNQTKNGCGGGGYNSFTQLTPKKEFKIKNSGKLSRAYESFAVGCAAFLLAYVAASILAPVNNSSAEEQEFSAKVANALSGVSVTASEAAINVDVGQPTATGKVVKVASSLTAQTAASSGYQLYISTDSGTETGNSLFLGGDTSAAFISPQHDSSNNAIALGSETALSSNSWGFTMDGTKYEDGQFATVPIMGNETLIKSTSVAGEDEIPIYFGVNVNTNIATGTYTGGVIYTIIAEDTESNNYTTPSVSLEKGVVGSQLTITLPLRSAITSVGELRTVNATIGGVNCNDQNVTLNSASLSISCTAPTQQSRGAKDVAVYVQQYGETYTKQSGFTYITNMQEMSTPICASMKASSTDILKDSRGSYTSTSTPASYGIIKALDGNCWMTSNFNLYGVTINAEDSDFGTGTYTIPGTANWTGNVYTEPKVHRATNSGYTDQVYYNWTAAVALSNGSTTQQQDQSICPKNWQLPVNGDANQDKSYAKLLNAYSITTGPQVVATTALGFTYSGYWNKVGSGSENYQGTYGHFWSSTPTSADNARYLRYNSSGYLDPQHDYNKGYGFSIRCVAR